MPKVKTLKKLNELKGFEEYRASKTQIPVEITVGSQKHRLIVKPTCDIETIRCYLSFKYVRTQHHRFILPYNIEFSIDGIDDDNKISELFAVMKQDDDCAEYEHLALELVPEDDDDFGYVDFDQSNILVEFDIKFGV